MPFQANNLVDKHYRRPHHQSSHRKKEKNQVNFTITQIHAHKQTFI